MGCCGQSRKQFHTHSQNSSVPGSQAETTSANRPDAVSGDNAESVQYEYIGATSITVRGPATGNIYRFRAYGDRVIVDARDASMIDSVPDLRRVHL